MKKWLLIVLSIILFSVKNCYANDSNIKVDTYRNENFVVEFSIGSEKVYGFTSSLEYDSNKLKLSNCTAHNDYEISTYQNNIVVESVKKQSNVKAATCYFEILDTKETSFIVKNINTSNYDEVVANKDINLKVMGNKTPTQVENIPDTAEGIGLGYILLGCSLAVCGGVIIFLLFNKKYSILCSIVIALCLVIPGRVDAAKDKINLSVTDMEGSRNVLLGKAESNLDYDFDGDEKITINDLIIAKVDLSRLNVYFDPQGLRGKTAYSNLSVRFRVNSTSGLDSMSFCIKKENETCSYTSRDVVGTQKSYVSEYISFSSLGNTKSQMCVKVSNKDGLTRNVCSNSYLLDTMRPYVSLNNNVSGVINGCNDAANVIRKNYTSYFNVKYGISGGNLSYGGAKKSGSDSGYDIYDINVTATGNNGLIYNLGRSIRCNKSVAFVGDNLATSSSGGLNNISLSPAIVNTSNLLPKSYNSTIIKRINNMAINYDKVFIVPGYQAVDTQTIEGILSIASAAKKRFGDNAIIILFGYYNKIFSQISNRLNSIGVRYVYYGPGSYCYASCFSNNYYITESGLNYLKQDLLKYI